MAVRISDDELLQKLFEYYTEESLMHEHEAIIPDDFVLYPSTYQCIIPDDWEIAPSTHETIIPDDFVLYPSTHQSITPDDVEIFHYQREHLAVLQTEETTQSQQGSSTKPNPRPFPEHYGLGLLKNQLETALGNLNGIMSGAMHNVQSTKPKKQHIETYVSPLEGEAQKLFAEMHFDEVNFEQKTKLLQLCQRLTAHPEGTFGVSQTTLQSIIKALYNTRYVGFSMSACGTLQLPNFELNFEHQIV